jgi:alkanesulfonate monooxygenase SsuD/methylene tetrahydromethanopterin reductase-like flavin-dependent oxidoreductase (luciferase family)
MTRFGIGMPSDLAPYCDRGLFMAWARLAEQSHFSTLAVIDKMNYDLWDPLTALAGAATITDHIRLATVILQLPNRNAVEVAKRAAVVDQMSGGRLDLGVGLGGHVDDYDIVGASFAGRGKVMSAQIKRIREVWNGARLATNEQGQCGPAPVQALGPPIWVGGWSAAAVRRAARLGDGFVAGIGEPRRTVELAAQARNLAHELGKTGFRSVALAYAWLGDGGRTADYRAITRYYGGNSERTRWVLSGSAGSIAERLRALGESGFDEVIVLPLAPDMSFVGDIATALGLVP